MTPAQKLSARIQQITADQQPEVLGLVELLAAERTMNSKRTSPIGLLADLGIDISAEEIDEARGEMWANFPRKDGL